MCSHWWAAADWKRSSLLHLFTADALISLKVDADTCDWKNQGQLMSWHWGSGSHVSVSIMSSKVCLRKINCTDSAKHCSRMRILITVLYKMISERWMVLSCLSHNLRVDAQCKPNLNIHRHRYAWNNLSLNPAKILQSQVMHRNN